MKAIQPSGIPRPGLRVDPVTKRKVRDVPTWTLFFKSNNSHLRQDGTRVFDRGNTYVREYKRAYWP